MFKKAKNIDTAFRQMRMVSLVAIGALLFISCFMVYKSYDLAKSVQSKIYVLGNGKALEAFASERKDNIQVEAREHIKSFHRLFFTLTPDDKYILETITRSLYLADNSAKRQYDNLQESNYYLGIISGNVSQTILIDSVSLDVESIPYTFRCYAVQEITRPTSLVRRSLVTEGVLREVNRSTNNPHGFIIERWKIVQNKDLTVKNR